MASELGDRFKAGFHRFSAKKSWSCELQAYPLPTESQEKDLEVKLVA